MNALGNAAFAFSHRLPNSAEIENAKQLAKLAAPSRIKEGKPEEVRFALSGGAEQYSVTLSPALAASLLELLKLVSSGCGFKVIPVGAELTTQQAADILNVPRKYLVKLLDEKEIPYVKKRRHRRIRADDLFAYKKKRDEIRSEALRELLEFDQEKGLL